MVGMKLLFTFDKATGEIGSGTVRSVTVRTAAAADQTIPITPVAARVAARAVVDTVAAAAPAVPLWASAEQRDEAILTMSLLQLAMEDKHTQENTKRFARWGYDRCRLVTMPVDEAGSAYKLIVQRAAGYLGVDAGPAEPTAPVLSRAYEQCMRILRMVPDLASMLG